MGSVHAGIPLDRVVLAIALAAEMRPLPVMSPIVRPPDQSKMMPVPMSPDSPVSSVIPGVSAGQLPAPVIHVEVMSDPKMTWVMTQVRALGSRMMLSVRRVADR